MKLSHKINKPIDFVFTCLTNMQKFVSIHPVISKIDEKSTDNYLIYETLKLGFIPFSFTYPVHITKNESKKYVEMNATVMGLTKIKMEFQLSAESKDIIVINETITITSILPLSAIMNRIFKKQHNQLFKNMEALN